MATVLSIPMPAVAETATVSREEVIEAVAFLDHLSDRISLLNRRQSTPQDDEIRNAGWQLFYATFHDHSERELDELIERVKDRSATLTRKWGRELALDIEGEPRRNGHG